MQRMGDIIDDRYLLTRPLGMRREAEMWEAEHQVSGRKVTMKIMGGDLAARLAAKSRFVAEARIAAEVSHSAIVEVYDVGVTADSAYLVSEQLRGETLADIITHQGAMQAEDACQVMLQVLAGLEAAHSARIVHGDLRAESIILRRARDGQLVVKLLDFGSPPAESSGGVPTSGSRGASGVLDPREDIHAAGAILFEMLTGRLGIRQGTSRASQASGTSQIPEAAQSLVPAIPAGLARVVDQALAPGSARSIGSAKEMASLLSPFAMSERAPALAPRDTLMPFLSPEARRSRGMARLERAVLGLGEPKERPSLRPNLILIDGANDAGPRIAESSARRSASEASRPSAEDLMEPRIPRPPRTPELGDSTGRFAKLARSENSGRGKKRSLGHRRWRTARPRVSTSDLTSLQAAAMQRVMRRIWSAGLLAAAGVGAGLLLGRLLHF